MLSFLYTGKLDPSVLANLAEELLILAEKYNIESLKSLSANHFISNISVENIASLVLLADTHHADKLKEVRIYKIGYGNNCNYFKACVRFLQLNRKAILVTEGWRNLVASHLQMAYELL